MGAPAGDDDAPMDDGTQTDDRRESEERPAARLGAGASVSVSVSLASEARGLARFRLPIAVRESLRERD